MAEISLTADQVLAINADRLAEECEAALGVPVAVYAQHWRGALIEARIRRVDGLPFANDDAAAARAVAAAHDPARLSSTQADAQAREAVRLAALDNLAGADVARLQGDVTNAATLEDLRAAALGLADLLADVQAIITTGR